MNLMIAQGVTTIIDGNTELDKLASLISIQYLLSQLLVTRLSKKSPILGFFVSHLIF